MITLGKTKSVCPICMKVLTAKKCIGEDGIYLVKECDIHGKFQTLIWEGTAAEYLSWGERKPVCGDSCKSKNQREILPG